MLYPELRGTDRVTETCGRCAGTGLYDGPTNATFHTATIGTTGPGCFYCRGIGSRSVLVSSARARDRRQKAAVAAAAAAQESHLEKLTAWETAGHREMLTRLEAAIERLSPRDPLTDQLRSALDGIDHISAGPAETAAAEAALEALTERENTPSRVPEGRVALEGEIVRIFMVDTDFGRVAKMIIQCDGFRLYGTVPAKLETQAGDRVAFTATCSQSETDPEFGFYKRPARASVIAGSAE